MVKKILRQLRKSWDGFFKLRNKNIGKKCGNQNFLEESKKNLENEMEKVGLDLLKTRKTKITIDRKFFVKQIYVAEFTAALDRFIGDWVSK